MKELSKKEETALRREWCQKHRSEFETKQECVAAMIKELKLPVKLNSSLIARMFSDGTTKKKKFHGVERVDVNFCPRCGANLEAIRVALTL